MTLPLLWVPDTDVNYNFQQIAQQFPVASAGGAPSGPAGGDLGGTYPNPTVAKAQAGFTIGGAFAVVTTDPRLSDSRAPNGAAGGDLSGTYPNPQIGTGVIVDADVSATAAVAESKLNLATDAAAGTGSRRTLGTGALQAAAGNDSRLSDSRAPNGAAGGDLSGTYPNPQIASGVIVNADVNAAAAIARSKLDFGSGLVNADVSATAAIAESKLSLATDAAAGTGSRRTLGTGATQAAAGNDSRLSDARTPTAHATSHQDGGTDALTVREPMMSTGTTGLAKGVLRAFRNAALSLATGGTVAMDGEDYDVSSWHTSAGGYVPQVAGYYRFSWAVVSNVVLTADVVWQANLRKNGFDEAFGIPGFQRGTTQVASGGSCIVQANGSTDAFTIVITHGTGGSAAIMVGRQRTWFTADLIGRT